MIQDSDRLMYMIQDYEAMGYDHDTAESMAYKELESEEKEETNTNEVRR